MTAKDWANTFSIFYLLGNLVAFPAGDSRALALRDLLSLDPGNQGADAPGLLLAIPDWDLLAGLPAELLAVDLGHLDTSHLGDIGALLAGEAAALTVSCLLAVSPGDVLAFLLLHSLALPLIDILALLPGHLAALLLGLLRALLGSDVTAHLGVVDLLTDLAGHGGADLGVDGVTFPIVVSGALLTGNVLNKRYIMNRALYSVYS